MKHAAIALISAFAFAASLGVVHAAGSDSDSTPVKTCKKGQVYSTTKKKCVKQTSQIIPDNSLKAQGWALARAGSYDNAIELFNLVTDKRDPEALNGLGFSHRKLGKMDTAIAYYTAALDANPDYVLAREYLGEGYLKMGQLDKAREQLAEIGNRCGTACEEYMLLATAIDTGKPIY